MRLGLSLVAIAVLLLGARAGGAWQAARRLELRALADSVRALEGALEARRAVEDSLIRAARQAEEHQAAMLRADRAAARAISIAAAARAAAADTALELATARAQLLIAADALDSMRLAHAAERRVAVDRLVRYEGAVTYQLETRSTVDSLGALQARRAAAALRRRPLWQRALGEICGLATTGGGAGGGALVGGPAGAAAGGAIGYVAGRFGCR